MTDLTQIPQQISPHFTLSEALFSQTATREGISNVPDDDQWAAIQVAAQGMERVREILGFPIHVNSWLRVEPLEKIVSAKGFIAWCYLHDHEVNDTSWAMYFPTKAHPKGYAVDFICPEFGTPFDIVMHLRESDLVFDQLIMEGTWVHLSFAPEHRGQILTATFDGNGEPHYEKEYKNG